MKLAIKTEPNKEKLEFAANVGYKAVEVYTARHFIEDSYSKLLRSFPFEYSVHAPVRYCDKSVFDFAESVSAKTVTVHCTYSVKDLSLLAEEAKERGLFLCIENEGVWGEDNYEHDLKKPEHLYTVRNGSDFVRLKELVPSISLTFDTEHSGMRDSTEDFWSLVRSGDVKHMHTSGYSGERGSWHSPPSCNPDRFFYIVNSLIAAKYEGFLTVEMHTKFHSKNQFETEKRLFDAIISQSNYPSS